MYTSDTERVIPRRRGKLGNILLQVLLVLLVLFFIAQYAFAEIFPDFIRELSDLLNMGLLIPIFGIPILFAFYSNWAQRRRWTALADEMGLKIEQKSRWAFPSISGTYRAHQVEISRHNERRGNNQVTYTDFSIRLNLEAKETLTIQGRKITHLNREKTGDEEIDKKLTISTSSKRLLQRLLNTRRFRLGLLQLGENARSRVLTLDGKTLHYRERGQISDTEYLQAALAFLVDLSNTIEGFAQVGI
jgi:hypothetical protein